jgi:translation initiation factor IF-1
MIRCRNVTLLSALGDRAFRARLPNGHELTAVVTRGGAELWTALEAGDVVELDISPADLSRGFVRAVASRRQKSQ